MIWGGESIKTNLLIFLLPVSIFLFCSEAPEVKPTPTERIVLAELFTWARCPYCPYAARALDSLAKEMKDSVAIIAYHRRLGGDTLSPELVEQRRAFYYEAGGEPAVLFDGTGPVWTSDPNEDYETYKNYLIGRRNQKSPLRLHLETSIQADTGIIKTTVVVIDSIPANDLRILVVLYEDSVRFWLPGASDSIFSRVMRLMIPDENGIACALAFLDSVGKEVRFPLNQNWNRNQLGVVAFVQDFTTKEVLQAILKKGVE
uniref:Omp28-related outer membrane protein n=1 Tax=candidate division WOR-3 bacterium TaxID=2052148 RepID=A0A7C6A8V2_UNCW3